MKQHQTLFSEIESVAILQDHFHEAYKCALHLLRCFDAVFAGDWKQAGKERDIIGQSTAISNRLRDNLLIYRPREAMLPVSRRDILNLLTSQHHIGNAIREIAGTAVEHRIHVPHEILASFQELLLNAVQAIGNARTAMDELKKLLGPGLDGPSLLIITRLHRALCLGERKCNKLEGLLLAELHKLAAASPEARPHPVHEVIELIGEIPDQAQRVGNRLCLLGCGGTPQVKNSYY